MIKYLLFISAIVLHILFCAESPLLYNYDYIATANYPLSRIIAGSIGYSVAGMLASIIFFVPIIYLFTREGKDKKFFKGFTFKSLNIALYLGVIIRIIIFIKNVF